MSEVVPFKRPPDPEQTHLGALIDLYLETRDMKAALEKKQKQVLKKYSTVMGRIEAKLMEMLQEKGLQSLSSDVGTAYLSHKRSAPISDGEAFKNFVIENRAWDMLDWKANITAVGDFVEQHQTLPPGVNYKTVITLGIMRK